MVTTTDNTDNIELSIVIPCLNEEETLPLVIPKALRSLTRLGIDGEVIIADNGSVDHSVAVSEALGARVVHCPERGYGSAVRCGFDQARGKLLLMGDADDSYNFDEIDDFITALRQGNDLVMGTRLKGTINHGAMPFLHRYLGTPVLTTVINTIFKTKLSDCNCGLRGLTKEAYTRLGLTAVGMEFASEMLIKAGILKLRIKEIPITLYKDQRTRPPHLHTWRDGWRHLRFILLFAPNFVFIWPAVTSFVVGTLILLLQIRGPFSFGDIYMDIHFMILGLTLSIVGVTVFQMGMIIKLFSRLQNYYTRDRVVLFIKKVRLEYSLITGSTLLLAGIIVDLLIVTEWAHNGFQNIHLSRMAIYGLYLIYTGVSIISFSFLRASMEKDISSS